MKKLTLLLAMLCALPAIAQTQPAQEPSADQLKTMVTILRTQRDQNAQTVQDLQVQLQIVSAELEKAKKQLSDLTQPKTQSTEPKK